MEKIPSIQGFVGLIAAALFVAATPVLAGDATTAASGAASVDPNERPQLVPGYRSVLGLKPSPRDGLMPGPQSATTQLLVRLAHARAISEPVFYAVERVPPALGLRGVEQAAGMVVRGGERWSSSFELSSAESALTANRRAALLSQLHAPLAGGVGVSAGIRYSILQTPAYAGSSADTPYGNGYVSSAGRSDTAAQQLGYQLQVNYLYGERNTVALTYNTRRESEQFRLGSDPSSPDASQLSVTGEHWFSPSWALRYDIPTPESSSQIRRPGLRLGVHYRF